MDYILIGEVLNTRGIKGELKIRAFTDFPEERFAQGNQVYIFFEKKYVKVKIEKYSKHRNMNLVVLKDLEDINLVEKYKGCEVFADMEQKILLKENEYYANDMKGMEVYQNDVLKGEVFDIRSYPHEDYLDVLGLDNEHHLVPFRDEFVLRIEFEYNRIEVIEMEGLL